MDAKEFQVAQERARNVICAAGIKLTDDEAAHIEVADFGLNRLASEGLELVTYVNNDRYCAKELVIFPGHSHLLQVERPADVHAEIERFLAENHL